MVDREHLTPHRRAELEVAVEVPTSAEHAFAQLTDWPAQGSWMPMTRVTASVGPTAPGTRIAAFTGLGPLGFLDTMVVTRWQPPHRCEVLHDGRLLRGPGVFAVHATGPDRCRVTWSEELELPFGRLGRLAWPVFRVPVRAALAWGLARFARYAAAQPRGPVG